MSQIEARLQELGLSLPAVPPPKAEYVPAVINGNLLFLAGVVPVQDGKPVAPGKVPSQVSPAAAAEAARICALRILAGTKLALGDLDRIERVVKLTCFVNADPTYDRPAAVADGCSRLLVEVLGRERGAHARSAVGVATLPMNACIEVEAVLAIRP